MSNLKTSLQVSILAALLVSNFAPSGYAKSPSQPQHKSTKKMAAPASLASLVKAKDSWGILNNANVLQAMKNVMGTEYPAFNERTMQLQGFESTGDEIFSSGGVQGLYSVQESAVSFNTKTNRAQVAMLDGEDVNIWGAANKNELSQSLQKYIADLQSRKAEMQSSEPLKFYFQAPNKCTFTCVFQEKSKPTIRRRVSTLSPVGTYERQSQWNGGTLQIIKLKGNKIKFALSAAHGANSGGASGVIALVGNKATYKGEGFKLGFEYQGKSFFVTETGEGFGGNGVMADGLYKKTDDRVPTIDDIY